VCESNHAFITLFINFDTLTSSEKIVIAKKDSSKWMLTFAGALILLVTAACYYGAQYMINTHTVKLSSAAQSGKNFIEKHASTFDVKAGIKNHILKSEDLFRKSTGNANNEKTVEGVQSQQDESQHINKSDEKKESIMNLFHKHRNTLNHRHKHGIDKTTDPAHRRWQDHLIPERMQAAKNRREELAHAMEEARTSAGLNNNNDPIPPTSADQIGASDQRPSDSNNNEIASTKSSNVNATHKSGQGKGEHHDDDKSGEDEEEEFDDDDDMPEGEGEEDAADDTFEEEV
jgi:hypothetical protein